MKHAAGSSICCCWPAWRAWAAYVHLPPTGRRGAAAQAVRAARPARVSSTSLIEPRGGERHRAREARRGVVPGATVRRRARTARRSSACSICSRAASKEKLAATDLAALRPGSRPTLKVTFDEQTLRLRHHQSADPGAVRAGRRRRVPAARVLRVAGAAEGRAPAHARPVSPRTRSRSAFALPGFQRRAAGRQMAAVPAPAAADRNSPARTTSTAGWTSGASPRAC